MHWLDDKKDVTATSQPRATNWINIPKISVGYSTTHPLIICCVQQLRIWIKGHKHYYIAMTLYCWEFNKYLISFDMWLSGCTQYSSSESYSNTETAMCRATIKATLILYWTKVLISKMNTN